MVEFVKTKEEIKILKEGGGRLAKILTALVESVKPDISTIELDRLAESLIFTCGGRPSFKGHRSKEGLIYPCSICVSINDEIVHGIPIKDKILKAGDVVGLDVGMCWPDGKNQKGMYTDTAITIGIGKVSAEAESLMRVTGESLAVGIKAVRPGVKLGDVSFIIQNYLEKNKLGVVRSLAGHGVGYAVHEEPLVPNFGKPGTGLELKTGMVLAIEPMATLGGWELEIGKDNWAFVTKDGSLGAHFEHTIAVTADGAEILTIV